MVWLSIAVFLNSAAIIVISRSKTRSKTTAKDSFAVMNNRINQNETRCDKALEAIEDLKKENRNIRSELVEKMLHQPLCDSTFIYGGWRRTHFGDALELNNEFMDYVASMALKTIVSELPEKIQTHEVVNEIIGRMKGEFAKSRIKL